MILAGLFQLTTFYDSMISTGTSVRGGCPHSYSGGRRVGCLHSWATVELAAGAACQRAPFHAALEWVQIFPG